MPRLLLHALDFSAPVVGKAAALALAGALFALAALPVLAVGAGIVA